MLHSYKIFIINALKQNFLPLFVGLLITQGVELPASVDDTIVLKIGPLEVSQYVVEKRYNRFLENLPSEAGNTPEAVSSWFEDFLVNQVITAKAVAEGYANHPEVIALVERMERHMLASLNGPYYQEIILKGTGRSEDEVRKMYLQTPEANQNTSFANYFRMIQMQDTQQTVQQLRSSILEEVQFSLYQENCDRLLEQLSELPPVPATIPTDILENAGEVLLASYYDDGNPASINAGEWIDYFNLLFVRSIPTQYNRLKALIEDMVVAERDIETARALGVDQEPKFVEDRKHFHNAQALDWFEREKLIPTIALPEEAIETYYQQHQESFLAPVAAKGLLLRFKEQENAIRWLQSYAEQPETASGHWDPAPDSIEEVEVTQEHPIPSLAPLTRAMLNAADGKPLGPVPTAEGVLIFLKQSSVKEKRLLADVSGYIADKLTRDRLHEMEKELAVEYCKAFEVEDRIAYEDFGVGSVKTPWSK